MEKFPFTTKRDINMGFGSSKNLEWDHLIDFHFTLRYGLYFDAYENSKIPVLASNSNIFMSNSETIFSKHCIVMVSRECLILNLILHPINTIIRIEGHFNPFRASARDSYLKILWKYSTTTLLIALLTNKNWTLIDEGNLNLSYPSGQLNIIWRRYQNIQRGVCICKDIDSKVELYFHDRQNRRPCLMLPGNSRHKVSAGPQRLGTLGHTRLRSGKVVMDVTDDHMDSGHRSIYCQG